MLKTADIAEYNIKRFKEIASTTNNLILIFVFTFFYVWYQSIQPNINRLRRYEKLGSIAERYEQPWINSLRARRDSLIDLYRNFHKIKDSIKASKADSAYKYYTGQKQEFKNLPDSLREKINLKIDIPTLSVVELPLRPGLFVWMFLFLFLLD